MSVKSRPVYLDLPKIRLPIPGIVSILHRISRVVYHAALPTLFPVRYLKPRIRI